MTFAQDTQLGLQNRFKVVVDGIDLGGWTQCKGLKVSFNLEKIKSGGEHDHMYYLPGHVEYSTITLVRAMNSIDAPKVMQWLSSRLGSFTGGTAQVTLLDAMVKPVHTWSLRNVFPMSWTGPEMNAKTSDIATEVLELAHEGFL